MVWNNTNHKNLHLCMLTIDDQFEKFTFKYFRTQRSQYNVAKTFLFVPELYFGHIFDLKFLLLQFFHRL